VSDGDLKENNPIEGEKALLRGEATLRVHRSCAASEIRVKWKENHRGHRSHRDPSGVNRVGLRPEGEQPHRRGKSPPAKRRRPSRPAPRVNRIGRPLGGVESGMIGKKTRRVNRFGWPLRGEERSSRPSSTLQCEPCRAAAGLRWRGREEAHQGGEEYIHTVIYINF
jgi:hypothetical protein